MVSVCVHPSNNYLISAATDGTWAFYDVAAALCVAQVGAGCLLLPFLCPLSPYFRVVMNNNGMSRVIAGPAPHAIFFFPQRARGFPHPLTPTPTTLQVGEDSIGAGGYTCAALHPDGLILGAGTADATVRIWETRTQKVGGSVSIVPMLFPCLFSCTLWALAARAADATVCSWETRTQKVCLICSFVSTPSPPRFRCVCLPTGRGEVWCHAGRCPSSLCHEAPAPAHTPSSSPPSPALSAERVQV